MAGRLRRAWGCFALFVLFVVGSGLLACESPTLPLPPPAVPSISFAGLPAGQVTLASQGGVEPNAVVVIYNPDPTIPLDKRVGGAQADSEGNWDATILASPGDFVEITQESGSATSPPTTVEIPSQ